MLIKGAYGQLYPIASAALKYWKCDYNKKKVSLRGVI